MGLLIKYLVTQNHWLLLTRCSLETPKRVIGKQCRPRSDAAECSILSGSPLFAKFNHFSPPASVAHLDEPPTGDQEVVGSTPRRGQQHSFVEIDHEIFSTVILSLLLIQEGQLSVSGERMCTILVNCLED